MKQRIAHISLLVKDYDEAIAFYRDKMGFTVLEDSRLSPSKRWVLIGPTSTNGVSLLLAKADGTVQEKIIGNQTAGRVFLFLETDNFYRDFTTMKNQGVPFKENPREESYGTVAVFEDLYGNLWDLIERKEHTL